MNINEDLRAWQAPIPAIFESLSVFSNFKQAYQADIA
jgi:hypothetical protein